MRTFIAAVAMSVAFAVSAWAIEGGQQQTEVPGPNFEQRKAAILKGIDARMTALQQDKACVEAAKNQEDLKACREKQNAAMREQREEMKKRSGHGGIGAPGGPGGPVPQQGR